MDCRFAITLKPESKTSPGLPDNSSHGVSLLPVNLSKDRHTVTTKNASKDSLMHPLPKKQVRSSDGTSLGGLTSASHGLPSSTAKAGDRGELFPLAWPRGVHLTCEACGGKATRQCLKCKVTYYCGVEHQNADGFHLKICDTVGFVRRPLGFPPSLEERNRLASQVMLKREELVEKITQYGLIKYQQEDYVSAQSVFAQAMRFAKELKEPTAPNELVLSTLLCDSNLCLGRTGRADFFLTLAMEISSNKQKSQQSNFTQAIVLKARGLVALAKKEYSKAMRFFGQSICLYAEDFGPDAIQTAPCYYYMGVIYTHQGNALVAETFYIHSLQNYLDYVAVLAQSVLEVKTRFRPGNFHLDDVPTISVPLALEVDIVSRLRQLIPIFEERGGEYLGKAYAASALLHFVKDDAQMSLTLISKSMLHLDADENFVLTNLLRQASKTFKHALANRRVPVSYTDT